MNNKRIYFLGIVCSLLLAGCANAPVREYSLDRLEAMTAVQEQRTPTFGADLCVITGDTGQKDSRITAEAAGLFSLSDQRVLYEKNPFERLYPASITKIMTALLAVKKGNLDENVTVGQEVVIHESGASLCHISPGDTLSMEELLYGLMLPSGNDAGAAIAVHMAGSQEAFSEMMNAEALALGATDTHFVNPHGLTDPQHYTTAYDLYLIFQEAMKYPEFRKVIGTISYTAEYTDASGTAKSQIWENSNQYLNGKVSAPDGVIVLGGKTGTTLAAGSCLIIGCEDENGKEYVSVVLKAEGKSSLYENMTNIIQKIVD